jgi:DNA adenine methylase
MVFPASFAYNGAMKENRLLRPFVKWAGGKRALLPRIREQFPRDFSRRTYHEPFLGAGAVFFDLMPRRAVINDSNAELMPAYRIIRDSAEDLIGILETHAKNHGEKYYYEIRNMDRDGESFGKLNDVQKAARLIYLNKTCYNGLYRVNLRGEFNVPMGRYRNPAICEAGLLRSISAYLKESDIVIMNADFETALSAADSDSFVYLDPPYQRISSTSFTSYQAGGFDEGEQERLRDLFVRLGSRGVKCLESNSDTLLIRRLYESYGFHIIPVSAGRSINSSASGRGAVQEVLIRNYQEQEG